MSIFLNLPSELSSQILSNWISEITVRRLDVAHCSPSCRPAMMAIFEGSIVKCPLPEYKSKLQRKLQWLVDRKLRVSMLELDSPQFSIRGFALFKELVQRAGKHLRRLDVYGMWFEIGLVFELLTNNCTQIETMTLECTITYTAAFRKLLESSRHLTHLEMVHCTSIHIPQLRGMLCPSITKIDFTGVGDDIADAGMALVRACPNLREYSQISGTIDMTVFPASMETFQFHVCKEFIGLDKDLCFPKAKLLRTGECGLTDDTLAKLVLMCPKVKDFALHLQHEASLHNLSLAESFGPSLTTLTLYSCHGLDEYALETILERCKALNTFNLINSAFTDDTTVYHTLLDSCPLVRRINVNMNELTDEILCRLSKAPLTHVSIHEAFSFTSVGLANLVMMCPTLQELITDSELLINPQVESLIKDLRPDLRVTSHQSSFYYH